MRSKSLYQIMFAICLLAVGVAILLVNIGVISLEIKQLFVVSYPFLLLVYGLISFAGNIINRTSNYFFSLFIIIFSSFLVLDRLHVISFQFVEFWKLWPLIIIFSAIRFLFGYTKKEVRLSKDFSIGDVKLNHDNWAVEPMELYNSIGDYFIDFSKAYIPEKETTIEINGWIGDIKILIPDDLPVNIEGEVKIGDLRIFHSSKDGIKNRLAYKSPDYDQAVKKINLQIYLKIGDIRIERV
ncbi:cell wall-active antibiotics response protein LiaF [Niallia sp. 01092]|uniref:cell wall-active antibiotics response protein LiaF n=1 Tax=unclassified Niallia TaxID=2837522 RepID=UPI003FD3574A